MARGLFTVFQDASEPVPTSRSTKPSTSQSRRKPGLSATSTSNVELGKENVDPFTKAVFSDGKKPMMKKDVKGSLRLKAPIVNIDTPILELSDPKTTTIEATGSRRSASQVGGKPSTINNNICTGNLRTRVLPASAFVLPSLPPRTKGGLPPPRRFNALATSSSESSIPSPAHSAVDSGYAPSEGAATDVDETDDDDEVDMDSDKTVRFAEAPGTPEAESIDMGREESDKEFNRRARSLTESPLAEVCSSSRCLRCLRCLLIFLPVFGHTTHEQVTEAYTGYGNFGLPSSANQPGTPPLRPAAPRRIRSSPSHSPTKPSAGSVVAGVRPKPYSQKSSSSARSRDLEELTKSVRSLRV